MDSANWILIGISGVTNGGKTNLSRRLNELLKGRSLVINQDDFFLDQDSDKHVIIPELNHPNYELVNSIDHEGLLAKILEATECDEPGILIVEGHLIYNMPSIAKMFNRKYFFTLTKEECWERRRVRVYDPKDPPGFFENCVWPMYLKNREEMERTQKNIVYLDGTEDKEEIIKFVVDDLHRTLSIDFDKS